jgi:signal transduction histidine kinase
MVALVAAALVWGFFTLFTQYGVSVNLTYPIYHNTDWQCEYFEFDEAGGKRALAFLPNEYGFLTVTGSEYLDAARAGPPPAEDDPPFEGTRHRVGFSAVLTEYYDRAILSVQGDSVPMIVFLDDIILHTDFPNLTSTPDSPPPGDAEPLEGDYGMFGNAGEIFVMLPADYAGRTLTVIQYLSAPYPAYYWQPATVTVEAPGADRVYAARGYGPSAVVSGLTGAALILFAALFLRQVLLGGKPFPLLLLIGYTLIGMIAASSYNYLRPEILYEALPAQTWCKSIADYAAGNLLLLYLALRMRRPARFALAGLAAAHTAVITVFMALNTAGDISLWIGEQWPGILGFAVSLFGIALSVFESRGNPFYKRIGWIFLALGAGYAILTEGLRVAGLPLYSALYDPFRTLWELGDFYRINEALWALILIALAVLTLREMVTDAVRRSARLTAAEQLNRLKTDFLASVAHEIKTPLTVLAGSARDSLDMLGEESPNTADIADNQWLIEKTVMRIDGIVLDLMDTSALETGRLTLRFGPVDLAGLLENVCNAYLSRTDIRGSRAELSLQPGLPPVRADGARLEQVMANLLTNAVKHTENGLITVSLSGRDGSQTVRVSDTGEGMDASTRRSAFRQYSTSGEDRWRHGIGLYLCRQIILAHGGEISLESGKGRGTTVSFSLKEGDRA